MLGMPLVPKGEFIPPALLPWPGVDLVSGIWYQGCWGRKVLGNERMSY